MAENFFESWIQMMQSSLSAFSSAGQSEEKTGTPHPVEAEIAACPKETVYENEILTLYRYASGEPGGVPLLMVNPLINGYYILDLLPELSLIRYLSEKGVAFYLIHWKNIEEYRAEYSFEYYLKHGVDDSVGRVYEREQKKLILAGHCLGGLLASSHLACGSDRRISKYLSLNSPCDLSKLGKIREMARFLKVDETVDFFGNIPAEQMKFLFQMINPALKMQAMTAIFFKSDPGFMRAYRALLKWREDHINMPGEFARTLLKDFFQENRLFEEKMSFFGKKASLKKIKVPVLNVVSENDDIAPMASGQGLKEKVPQTEEMILPDGHLALTLLPVMGQDVLPFWKKLLDWILA